MDVLTKSQRSYCMSRIRSDKTKPELILKKALWGSGFSYQSKMLGKPDFVHRKKRVVIFVDGCFWHKCPKCYKEPKTRKDFWLAKIDRNVKRDREVNRQLREADWKIIRIWEHEIKENLTRVVKKCLNQ